MLTYTDELCSPDFKLCVQEAISALSTDVDNSINIIVRALYGTAACRKRLVEIRTKDLTTGLTKSVRK